MMILCFYYNIAFAYLCIAWHIPPVIPFSTINNILISVNNFSFTSVILKQACHANPGADRRWTGSSLSISIHLFLKF